MGTSVFRMYGPYRAQIIILCLLVWVIAVVWIALAATQSEGPGWVFSILWMAMVIYVTRQFLWCVPYELRLEDDIFVWKVPFRSGAVPVAEIRRLRPAPGAPNAEKIELSDGTRLMVIMRKGFREFLADLAQRAPNLPIQVNSYFLGLSERRSGTGGYERRHLSLPPQNPIGPGSPGPPPGWYADPSGQAQFPWWDGQQWTAEISEPTPPGRSSPTPTRFEEPQGWSQRWVFASPRRLAPTVWIATFLFINLTTGNLLAGTTIRQYRLATQGRSTTATVTGLDLSNHGGCTYSYRVGGVQYSRSESACGSGQTAAGYVPRIGDILKVTYVADDPGIATTSNTGTLFWEDLALDLGAPTLFASLILIRGRRRTR